MSEDVSNPKTRSLLPSRGSHRLRIGRRSEPETLYFITTRTVREISILAEPPNAEILLTSIRWMESIGKWHWLCYVIMPNHLHVVIELKQKGSLDDVLHDCKRYTSRQINKQAGRQGALWQDGYFDHRIRSYEKLEQIAFYCFRDPVNAGLAKEGKDWPHFGCKPDLWIKVQERYDDLLALESEKKLWNPAND
jgi:putative transposase